MPLTYVRKQLNILDNAIKNIILVRMSVIPVVGKIKDENNLPLFQPERERQMYESMKGFCSEKGLDTALIESLYRLIIKNAIEIEEKTDINKLDLQLPEELDNKLKESFERLNNILENEIPEILKEIEEISKDVNLSKICTYYYAKAANRDKELFFN